MLAQILDLAQPKIILVSQILETGTESYRFRRTLAKKGSKASN